MPRQTTQWEDQFQGMEQEWVAIGRRELNCLLDEWQPAMADMTREYHSLVANGSWVSGPSDFLSIIHRQRDELTHSRLLAWLLTPTGRHGLGSAFLTRLLEYCRGTPIPALPTVRDVTCEYTRNDRRADVVVWGRDFTLVIENKVDAGEQPAQCDDLYECFRDEPDPLFVFLSPDGRPPTTATTDAARAAFKAISWPRVRVMIEDVAGSATSQVTIAAAVVDNYTVTLKEQFG